MQGIILDCMKDSNKCRVICLNRISGGCEHLMHDSTQPMRFENSGRKGLTVEEQKNQTCTGLQGRHVVYCINSLLMPAQVGACTKINLAGL